MIPQRRYPNIIFGNRKVWLESVIHTFNQQLFSKCIIFILSLK